MGMTGIVFVRPKQNGRRRCRRQRRRRQRYAYNDGDGSTAYDREFVVHADEIWARGALRRRAHPAAPTGPTTRPTSGARTAASYPDTLEPNGNRRQTRPRSARRARAAALPAHLLAGPLQRRRPGAAAARRTSATRTTPMTCDRDPDARGGQGRDPAGWPRPATDSTRYTTEHDRRSARARAVDVIFTAPPALADDGPLFLLYDRNYAASTTVPADRRSGGQMTEIRGATRPATCRQAHRRRTLSEDAMTTNSTRLAHPARLAAPARWLWALPRPGACGGASWLTAARERARPGDDTGIACDDQRRRQPRSRCTRPSRRHLTAGRQLDLHVGLRAAGTAASSCPARPCASPGRRRSPSCCTTSCPSRSPSSSPARAT